MRQQSTCGLQGESGMDSFDRKRGASEQEKSTKTPQTVYKIDSFSWNIRESS